MDYHCTLYKGPTTYLLIHPLVPETGPPSSLYASRIWTTNGGVVYLNVSVYTARLAFLYEL